jgi:hypothetical protein
MLGSIGLVVEPVIHGDNVRFQEHQKPCDNINSSNSNCHDYRYRYPISYKNAKKGEIPLMGIALLQL